jgi:hypothetical protein
MNIESCDFGKDSDRKDDENKIKIKKGCKNKIKFMQSYNNISTH